MSYYRMYSIIGWNVLQGGENAYRVGSESLLCGRSKELHAWRIKRNIKSRFEWESGDSGRCFEVGTGVCGGIFPILFLDI
jgi:hypothetical protein